MLLLRYKYYSMKVKALALSFYNKCLFYAALIICAIKLIVSHYKL